MKYRNLDLSDERNQSEHPRQEAPPQRQSGQDIARNIIRTIGLGWAGLGLYGLYGAAQDGTQGTGFGLTVILIFLLFILPGLLLAK